MNNRLSDCPELDPMTDAMPITLLAEELQNMGLTVDSSFNLLRDGKPEGCVVFVGTWAFILRNPVCD